MKKHILKFLLIGMVSCNTVPVLAQAPVVYYVDDVVQAKKDSKHVHDSDDILVVQPKDLKIQSTACEKHTWKKTNWSRIEKKGKKYIHYSVYRCKKCGKYKSKKLK